MKVKPVILIFIRNFKIFTDVFPKRIKVVLRCELYAVLSVLLETTLELVGYSLWLTVGTIVCIWGNKCQSRWCRDAIFPGLMWDETSWGLRSEWLL